MEPEDFSNNQDALIQILREGERPEGPTPLWNADKRGDRLARDAAGAACRAAVHRRCRQSRQFQDEQPIADGRDGARAERRRDGLRDWPREPPAAEGGGGGPGARRAVRRVRRRQRLRHSAPGSGPADDRRGNRRRLFRAPERRRPVGHVRARRRGTAPPVRARLRAREPRRQDAQARGQGKGRG